MLGLAALTLLMSSSAFAADLSMWVRESASDPGQLMVDLWNAGHEDQIELTAIPDNQLVTKLATSVRAGDAPDLRVGGWRWLGLHRRQGAGTGALSQSWAPAPAP